MFLSLGLFEYAEINNSVFFNQGSEIRTPCSFAKIHNHHRYNPGDKRSELRSLGFTGIRGLNCNLKFENMSCKVQGSEIQIYGSSENVGEIQEKLIDISS